MDTPAIVRWVIDTFEGHLFTDDPVDTGGATKFGFTLRTIQYARRKWTGNPALIVTKADVRNLTIEEAVRIGVEFFMEEPQIDRIPDWRVRLVVYDYGFHSGQDRAVRAMQSWLTGVVVDGRIGPATIAAAGAADPVLLTFRILTDREEFMQRLMDAKPSQRRFLLGWWRRTTALQRLVVAEVLA